jgi:hypothetical protein
MPADPLAISVTRADGSVVRWGAEELNPQNVATGLTWDTSIPGGYKTMSCGLLRDYAIDHPDQALFDNVRVYGRGGKTRVGRSHERLSRRARRQPPDQPERGRLVLAPARRPVVSPDLRRPRPVALGADERRSAASTSSEGSARSTARSPPTTTGQPRC